MKKCQCLYLRRLPRSSDARFQSCQKHAYCVDGAWLKAFETTRLLQTLRPRNNQERALQVWKGEEPCQSANLCQIHECARLPGPISRLHWHMLQRVCHRDQKLRFSVKSWLVHNYRLTFDPTQSPESADSKFSHCHRLRN